MDKPTVCGNCRWCLDIKGEKKFGICDAPLPKVVNGSPLYTHKDDDEPCEAFRGREGQRKRPGLL